jgi:hypothetical protein
LSELSTARSHQPPAGIIATVWLIGLVCTVRDLIRDARSKATWGGLARIWVGVFLVRFVLFANQPKIVPDRREIVLIQMPQGRNGSRISILHSVQHVLRVLAPPVAGREHPLAKDARL